ncbi:M55 family metallopeptidase [Micromonospora sp. B11E3]|uniref:M55 family metallopeptidase n=1 Tax=Micromonospora sp. B11E3 TaxID=3153562 RepID=UPI00325F3455
MKVFVSSDMEGVAGVVDWEQVSAGGPRYEYFTQLLTGEINAAIEGAIAAGATEFVVNDAHSKMSNIKPDSLAGNARYLSGRYKPMYMMEGLDDSFDAVFLIAYHGSMSATGSALSHTYFRPAIAEVRINGVIAGESGVNALVAAAHGVPILLVTGDEATAVETASFAPRVRAAVVKRSVSRFAAESLHPQSARDLIRETAHQAVSDAEAATPPQFAAPLTMDIAFHTSDYCELAARVAGVERTSSHTAVLRADDPLTLYRCFVTVVLLCRGLVE